MLAKWEPKVGRVLLSSSTVPSLVFVLCQRAKLRRSKISVDRAGLDFFFFVLSLIGFRFNVQRSNPEMRARQKGNNLGTRRFAPGAVPE